MHRRYAAPPFASLRSSPLNVPRVAVVPLGDRLFQYRTKIGLIIKKGKNNWLYLHL